MYCDDTLVRWGLLLLCMVTGLACSVGCDASAKPTPIADISAIAGDAAHTPKPGWNKHEIALMNGKKGHCDLDAAFQIVNASWGRENLQMPNLIYMPENKRLIMTGEYGPPSVKTIVIVSDDMGATWSPRRWMHTDAQGAPDVGAIVGPTYLGNGVISASSENESVRVCSYDYGATWERSVPASRLLDGQELYHWDPALIDRDKDGKITRLMEARWKTTGRAWESGVGPYSQGCIAVSGDLGKTWSTEVVPQWLGVNEVALIRAKNDTIVAACRTDNAARFIGQLDLYSGLGISISKDNGKTWSKLNILYEYGRHHPSLVMLPNGDIVMSYGVRVGYTSNSEGFARYGAEAIVSHNNGVTWDLDHKYVLATWSGKIKGGNAWWGLIQSTSTLLLPDGSLLTSFGFGARNEDSQTRCIMDTGLVKWRISNRRLDSDKTIRSAPFDSETRNVYDLDAVK